MRLKKVKIGNLGLAIFMWGQNAPTHPVSAKSAENCQNPLMSCPRISDRGSPFKKALCLLISQARYGKQLTQDYSLVFSYFHVGEMRISSRIYPYRPLRGLVGQNDLLSILIFQLENRKITAHNLLSTVFHNCY